MILRKIYLFFTSLLFILISSCAEEGPYPVEGWNINLDVQVVDVSFNSATLKVYIPYNSTIDMPYGIILYFDKSDGDYRGDEYSLSYGENIFTSPLLSHDTEYSIRVKLKIYVSNWQWKTFDTGVSFKTMTVEEFLQKEENWPVCEVVENYKDFGIVNFKFNDKFYNIRMCNAYASQTKDFPEESCLTYDYIGNRDPDRLLLVPKLQPAVPLYFKVNSVFYMDDGTAGNRLLDVKGFLPEQNDNVYLFKLSAEIDRLNFCLSTEDYRLSKNRLLNLHWYKVGEENNPIFTITDCIDDDGKILFRGAEDWISRLDPNETYLLTIPRNKIGISNALAPEGYSYDDVELKWTWKLGEQPVRVE